MEVPADLELLAAYARQGSHEAFARIVHRHVDLVYSAALRLTGDTHHAQDVTQTVFLRLATKASVIDRRIVLAGWLLSATRYVAADLVAGVRASFMTGRSCRVILPDLPPMPGSANRIHGTLWRQSEFDMPRPANWDQMDAEHRRQYENRWRSSPDGLAWKRSVCNYEFPISGEDGGFRIPDVRPGRYRMHIEFELRDKAKDQLSFRATADRHLIVPDDPAPAGSPPIDMGGIPVIER